MLLMATARHLIKGLRQEHGLSQRELARLADVDHTYLSRFERGVLKKEPTDRWLRDVATALGANLVRLQKGEDS